MSIAPHMSFPSIQPLAAAEQPHRQPRLAEGLSFAPSHPVWMGEAVKPPLPAPLPCSGGFIERDLLLKPRPQSSSVWSSLPETGISFPALYRAVTVILSWWCWILEQPFGIQQGWVYFQVMGALCKHSPSVGDQRQTPKSRGFGKPKTRVSCY